VSEIKRAVIEAGKFNPQLVVQHPEGLVIKPEHLIPVCSECGWTLEPTGSFGNGVHVWTCGCVLIQEEWQ
jgi:hypothetical protein